MLRRKFIATAGSAVTAAIMSKAAMADLSSVPASAVAASETYTHQNAPTLFVDVGNIRFAYRRFGKRQGVPLVMFQHFIGTMDNWDPAVTDGFAQGLLTIINEGLLTCEEICLHPVFCGRKGCQG
jgi:hypothetical protein